MFKSERFVVPWWRCARWQAWELQGRLRRVFNRQLRRNLSEARDREREERIAARVLERLRPLLLHPEPSPRSTAVHQLRRWCDRGREADIAASHVDARPRADSVQNFRWSR